MYTRRSFLGGIAAAAVSLAVPRPAKAAPLISFQRQLSLQMARAYALNGNTAEFRRLFDEQAAFLGLGWPQTELVVTSAMSALRRILDGEFVTRMGLRKVKRLALPGHRYVVFSDQHAMPASNRQSGVWRANRDAYASLLHHYGEEGWIVVENGDVEDLVVVEPDITVAMYKTLTKSHGRTAAPRVLVGWYRDDPEGLVAAIRAARQGNRQRQLEQLLSEPGNQPYYDALRQLAKSGQLVRLAGNHDYNLQDLNVGEEHLIPDDVLVLEGDHPQFVVMHGHQFDSATHPGVAPLYGEVVSECLGVWYQGPDRSWSVADCRKILEGGFPNRLATHQGSELRGNLGTRFLRALVSSPVADDEEWAAAWEGLFGHPIAWEYGARDWSAAVHGHLAHPGDLVDEAMTGKQFFKFRHLDEWEILRSLNAWNLQVGLILGHSHEARYNVAGWDRARYYNSGAVGRFTHLLWAVEVVDQKTVNIVGWFVEDDGSCHRVEFLPRESDLTAYFQPRRTETRVAVRSGGAA